MKHERDFVSVTAWMKNIPAKKMEDDQGAARSQRMVESEAGDVSSSCKD
jgi:hypothetical protein